MESYCNLELAGEVENYLLLRVAGVMLLLWCLAACLVGNLVPQGFLGCSLALEEAEVAVEFDPHCLVHLHYPLNPVESGRAHQCCLRSLELQVAVGQRTDSLSCYPPMHVQAVFDLHLQTPARQMWAMQEYSALLWENAHVVVSHLAAVEAWNRHWKDLRSVLLTLCGSGRQQHHFV